MSVLSANVRQAADEYGAAIEALRGLYLVGRHDDETVADWLRRTGRDRGWFGGPSPIPYNLEARPNGA